MKNIIQTILTTIMLINFMSCEKNSSMIKDELSIETIEFCGDSLSFDEINFDIISKRWIMISYQSDSNCINNWEPKNDDYPIILDLTNCDSLYGRHDANDYYGRYQIDSNKLIFKNISVTDVGDLVYYWDFIDFLDTNYVISLEDSLCFYSQDFSKRYCFITDSIWNLYYENIDSIYNR